MRKQRINFVNSFTGQQYNMKTIIALTGGLAGACILTAIHQLVKNNDAYHAPRMDLLGMQSLTKAGHTLKLPMPTGDTLYNLTMAADVVSNAIYYSAAGVGKNHTLLKSAALGLAAGVGAVYLPQPMGLDPKPSNRTPQTKVLSVIYYLTGGLVAGGIMHLLNKRSVAPNTL